MASAELSNEGKEQLQRLVPTIRGKRSKLEIRGHATRNPLPPGSPFQDAWQLCHARCLATRKYLEQAGVQTDRMRLSQAGVFEPYTIRANLEKQNSARGNLRPPGARRGPYRHGRRKNRAFPIALRGPTPGTAACARRVAIPIDKDVVRRILARQYQPEPASGGPSWLTFIGHMKDSLWSLDLFRCESATLRTHWVLVVMDQFTRRIIGFGLHAGAVDGIALCRMFNRALRGHRSIPKYLSSDNDPLYRFHQWQANLRILEVAEIKTVPYVPLSHPFVERLIGTLRRECLDRTLFWTTADLESKLLDFKTYFNHHRTHSARAGRPPEDASPPPVANLQSYRWKSHCRGLYETPIAA